MFYIDIDNESEKKFDLSKFMKIDSYTFEPFSSYMLYEITKLPPANTFVITTQAGRPDNLSYALYGDTQYWWILLLYNGLTQPNQLKENMTIKYPSLDNLNQLYLNASINQKTQ